MTNWWQSWNLPSPKRLGDWARDSTTEVLGVVSRRLKSKHAASLWWVRAWLCKPPHVKSSLPECPLHSVTAMMVVSVTFRTQFPTPFWWRPIINWKICDRRFVWLWRKLTHWPEAHVYSSTRMDIIQPCQVWGWILKNLPRKAGRKELVTGFLPSLLAPNICGDMSRTWNTENGAVYTLETRGHE